MSAPPPAGPMASTLIPASSVAMSRRRARAASLPVKPKPRRTEDAAVGFHHHHVPRQLGQVTIAIAETSAPPFSSLVHSTTRTVRRGRRFNCLHQAQRLPHHHASAAIVGRSGPDVPRVDVAADDDHFVRQLAAAQLADDVGRLGVGQEVRLHDELQAHRRSSIAHALQAGGILGRHRSAQEFAAARRRTATPPCAACEGRRDRPHESASRPRQAPPRATGRTSR